MGVYDLGMQGKYWSGAPAAAYFYSLSAKPL
jgi:hypothetical protein